MRRSFLAGLLAAVSVLPSAAIAGQREDLTVGSTDVMTPNGNRQERANFDGQRGDGQRGGGDGQRGGGFRQREAQQQAQPQQAPAPQPQAAPPPPAQVQQPQRQLQSQTQFQRGGFDPNRQGFRRDRGGDRGQFRQDFQRGQGQVQTPPVIRQEQPSFRQDQQRNSFQDQRRDNRQDFRQSENNRFRGDANRYDGNRFNQGNRGYNDSYRNRDYGNRGAWNRDWRGNNNYNWQGYRSYNRGAFRLPRYYAPSGFGYGYRRFGIGFTLSSILFDQNYWIQNPEYYRLPPAYGPYEWVRYYNDALLVDIRTGYVVDTVYDIFW